MIDQTTPLAAAAEKKAINPTLFQNSAYQPNLLQSSVPSSVQAMVSPSLVKQCNDMQVALHDIADIPGSSGINIVKPSKFTQQFQKALLQKTNAVDTLSCEELSLPPSHQHKITIKGDIGSNIQQLQLLPREQLSKVDWQALASTPKLTATHYVALFYLATKAKQPIYAEIFITRPIQKQNLYWQWNHLGDLYFKSKHFEEANIAYKKANELEKSHPAVLAKLADIHTVKHELEQATSLLTQAKALDANHVAVLDADVRLTRALKQQVSTVAKTQNGQAALTNEFKTLTNYDEVLAVLAVDQKRGHALDEYMMRSAFLMRNNHLWLTRALTHLSLPAQHCLIEYLLSHMKKQWHEETLSTEYKLLPHSDIRLVDHIKPENARNLEPSWPHKIGVHLHVYYFELVPQILCYLRSLPSPSRLVVTCKPGLRNKLITLKEHFPDSHIIEVENRGRDIAPWLIDAAPLLAKCDYVLKIHTKATPHAPELAGWRLQLLWSLLGSTDHIRAILDNFESNKNLGLILPEYHPKLRNDIKWGNNFMLAKDVFAKIGIDIDQKTLLQPPLNFPAGSMFWYRTDALDTLLSKKGSIDDFPDEKGQTDGTIMHAIERLVCIVAKTHSFNSIFVSMYP